MAKLILICPSYKIIWCWVFSVQLQESKETKLFQTKRISISFYNA